MPEDALSAKRYTYSQGVFSKGVEQPQELVVYVFPMDFSKRDSTLGEEETSVSSGRRDEFGTQTGQV
jgi:hypothetical protein